jgi:hypothetical protein
MVKRVGKLVREMSVESPAQAHIEDLASAANPQKVFPVRGGSFDHLQFNGITLWVHVIDAGMCLPREVLRSNIPPTGKEDPV